MAYPSVVESLWRELQAWLRCRVAFRSARSASLAQLRAVKAAPGFPKR